MIHRRIPKRRLVAVYNKLCDEARHRLFLTMLDDLPISAAKCEVLVDNYNDAPQEQKRAIFFEVVNLYCIEEDASEKDNYHTANLRAVEGTFS